MNRVTGSWRRAAAGLRLALWTWFALAIAMFAISGFRMSLIRELFEGYDSLERIERLLDALAAVAGAVPILGSIVVAVGLFSYARLPRDTGARGLATVAAWLHVATLPLTLLYLAADTVWRLNAPFELLQHMWWVSMALEIGALVALVAAMARASRSFGRPLPGSELVAFGGGVALAHAVPLMPGLGLVSGDFPLENSWLWMAMITGGRLVELGALSVLVRRHLRDAAIAGKAAAPVPTSSGGYRQAASGVALYAAGLKARLFVLCVGAMLMLSAAFVRSTGAAQVLLVLLPLGALLTTAMVLTGVGKLAFGTEDPGGRVFSTAGFTALAVTALAEVWAVITVLDAITGRDHPQAALAHLQYAQGFAQVAGLLGITCLLIAFHQIARRLDAEDIAQRARTVGALVLVTAAVAFGFRWAVADARAGSAGAVVLGGLVVLALAIAMFVTYLRLLRDLAQAMREPPELVPDLPAARIVEL